MRRPKFMQKTPDDNERYGPAAADVLAHIRYRCGSDAPDCIVVDGLRWWRVSMADLGHEIGLSRRAVQTALDRLGDAVVAEHFKPLANPSRAYRPSTDMCSAVEAEHETVPTPAPKRAEVSTETCSVPLIEKVEKEGEGAGQTDRPAALAGVPDSANGPALQIDPSVEPQRYCNEHMPDGTPKRCPACGWHRDVHKRWETARAEAARHARPPRPPWRCLTCRDTDIVLSTDGAPARGPYVCLHDGTRRPMRDADKSWAAKVLHRLASKDGKDGMGEA